MPLNKERVNWLNPFYEGNEGNGYEGNGSINRIYVFMEVAIPEVVNYVLVSYCSTDNY